MAEPYRRVFATLRPDGGFSLFSTIQPQPLLNTRLGAEVRQMAFAPRGVACCWRARRAGSAMRSTTRIRTSRRSLWGKVWYENYPQPAYVWQSTSGEDSYQPKFSLMPVIFGTFKAAAYAMLFAIPRRWPAPSIPLTL